jgi:ribosomal protein L11 methyltransferase
MYLWQRLATARWWTDNEEKLRAIAGNRLAVIEAPIREQLQLEAAFQSQRKADLLAAKFRGRVRKLPRDWLKRFARDPKIKPLRVGKRLIVEQASASRRKGGFYLFIPAGAAFGTGDHATTAMSLRLLEQISRKWRSGWSFVDLGTGSGILALAAKRFGAERVLGIDSDPVAISTAKENARINRIGQVTLQVTDVRRWKPSGKIDLIAANLFSELQIEILPKLKRARWMILSGVLRKQEQKLTGALSRNRIVIAEVRRRGKWVAILAQKRI